ncbi:RsmB/NOP family class I SAM-dependent RNA methyltransferase [Thermodesulfobacterium sp. TA1]|uniref:NOL1/NOP2/sun family putative RNA methylase n=1 Tax=Thermodesulfobacterium sp. TA1 TaxID=2234087 RepID=UPI001232C7AC|nr:RsmB/NOP family class I SAM-dependent RNA methyltransferase [Thermodesulfobacterium sp. TA1]QER41738.1 RsmB/NOP family class I SAM-dependent RNA methyltransferase [Thermodesulfobacterium sp. TA1]
MGKIKCKKQEPLDHRDYFAQYQGLIPDYLEFLECLKKNHRQYFCINTLKIKTLEEKERLLTALKQQNIHFEPVKEVPYFYRVVNNEEVSLGNLEEYSLGLIHSMTLASSLPVIALEPKPGDLILDLCAAPGGKTCLMAILTQDKATVVANDKRVDRLTALVANLKRLGVASAITTRYRGEQFPFGVPFNKILVDAPCSGEGRYRVGLEGEILYQKGQGRANLQSIQKGLLVRAFDLLAPGGVLVYSTCTINPKENEEVVDYLLRKRQAKLIDWNSPLPYQEGVTEWEGKPYHPDLKLTKRYYTHKIDAVGFFVAKIIKLT